MCSHVESDAQCARLGVTRDAFPVQRVNVGGFSMDVTELINGEFARFACDVDRRIFLVAFDRTRYMVGTRARGEVSTGSKHVGVRSVRN